MMTTIQIHGMHCASCQRLLQDVCRDIPGVTSCEIDDKTGMARIEHDDTVTLDHIRREIEGAGSYTITTV